METYTKEEFLKAAEIGEVSMIDAQHVVSLLDEARLFLSGELYEFVESKGKYDLSVCSICELVNICDGDDEDFCKKYPCSPSERSDEKNGYYRKKV